MKRVLVLLTPEQHAKLVKTLDGVDDCGPEGEGWRSSELIAAVEAFKRAIPVDDEDQE